MKSRRGVVPIFVYPEGREQTTRAINAVHVQTFVPNPHGAGTLITFWSGDEVIVSDDFQIVLTPI